MANQPQLDHRFNLKHHGLTHTAAGTAISTVEQQGEWTGHKVGRLWVRIAGEGATWRWHGLASNKAAFAAALKLANSSEDQIREYFA